MKRILSSNTYTIPEDVEVKISNRVVTVKGKYGTCTRSFKHVLCELFVENGNVVVNMWLATKKQAASINSVLSHIKNMCTGVQYQFQYKMRLVYNHFPISTNIVDDGHVIEIRNFMGENRTRVIPLEGDAIITKTATKDEIAISGIDVNAVAKSCAAIHQSCLVRNKDIRKFLDGIYVSERGTVDEIEVA
ncbi:MAG: hypothetical protein KVP17_003096 [Porospora cf. gigantea B]|uniref:uncharacterized protein n=1 Tax=Porospora cf. gigantea B TaxID=2853592 RepID=UPI003571BC47|nr:MAG: hypothetical protein KVP17_003096 [Porospora cf. gigantea B]